MRSWIFALGLAPVALLGSSCAEEPKPLLADIAWQLSCSGTPVGSCPQLSIAGKSYDYIQYDGEVAYDEQTAAPLGVVDAICDAYDLGNDIYRVRLASNVGGTYFDISGLVLNAATDEVVASACHVTLSDGTNTFGGTTLGGCSGGAPSTGAPCQISNVSVTPRTSDGASVEIRLQCDGISNEAQPTSKVSVRDALVPTQPAMIRFVGCSGF